MMSLVLTYGIGGFEWIFINLLKSAASSLQISENIIRPPYRISLKGRLTVSLNDHGFANCYTTFLCANFLDTTFTLQIVSHTISLFVRYTVHAVNFAGLIFSHLAAQKHTRGLLNSRWAILTWYFLYCTNTWHHTTIHLQAAGQHKNRAGLTHSPVYYRFASTYMVNTQLLRVQNVHTKYRKYFCRFLNSHLLNFARNLRKFMCH